MPRAGLGPRPLLRVLEEVSELEGAAEQQVKDLNLGREREACSAGGLLGGPWASTHGPGVPAAPWLEVLFPILPEKTNTYLTTMQPPLPSSLIHLTNREHLPCFRHHAWSWEYMG